MCNGATCATRQIKDARAKVIQFSNISCLHRASRIQLCAALNGNSPIIPSEYMHIFHLNNTIETFDNQGTVKLFISLPLNIVADAQFIARTVYWVPVYLLLIDFTRHQTRLNSAKPRGLRLGTSAVQMEATAALNKGALKVLT